MLSEIHQQRSEPDEVVSQLFRETVYAGHPASTSLWLRPHRISDHTRGCRGFSSALLRP